MTASNSLSSLSGKAVVVCSECDLANGSCSAELVLLRAATTHVLAVVVAGDGEVAGVVMECMSSALLSQVSGTEGSSVCNELAAIISAVRCIDVSGAGGNGGDGGGDGNGIVVMSASSTLSTAPLTIVTVTVIMVVVVVVLAADLCHRDADESPTAVPVVFADVVVVVVMHCGGGGSNSGSN